jgi:hypothetical protein
MGLLVAKKDEVVIVMPAERLDTNTYPEAEKMLMAQLEARETLIALDFFEDGLDVQRRAAGHSKNR